MTTFTIFDINGDSNRTLNCDESDLFLNLQAGEKYIVGEYQDHYLVNNQPVQKPPRPSEYHNWDVTAKVWVERADRIALELAAAKTLVMAETEAFKAKAREMLIGVSHEEELNLKEKYEASKRILAGAGTIIDKALIAGEVAARVKYDFLQLAQVIVTKGDAQAAFLAMAKIQVLKFRFWSNRWIFFQILMKVS